MIGDIDLSEAIIVSLRNYPGRNEIEFRTSVSPP